MLPSSCLSLPQSPPRLVLSNLSPALATRQARALRPLFPNPWICLRPSLSSIISAPYTTAEDVAASSLPVRSQAPRLPPRCHSVEDAAASDLLGEPQHRPQLLAPPCRRRAGPRSAAPPRTWPSPAFR
ncbi:hypothetical protein PAHAL_2G177100 [Panicum hallii]|uniref:Uncharacterized protein n=1 Tax=Panicum hallii TaxID=206008 RepID=A0A2S3GYH0_9POAL|nr:hypothetical protein PAHAL_2G177100 [Panicum hallii]